MLGDREGGVDMSFVKNMMSRNFIEFASYVIKDRAIPEISDGLKPVQRRIFHSLNEMDDGKFNKVANVIGNTMKYHPHGDASISSALVVLANKEYFIEKQGNFGNIYTGDEASAARYIECRLSSLAKETMFNKELTEYLDSYDGRNKEPVSLPTKIPVLLLSGAEGIAVGMSTKILSHNFNELLKAQIAILNKQEFEIYPDFFQGGIIDVSEYSDGNGKVKIRALIEKPNDKTLLIKEIPYCTTTESLIESIDNASKKGKIKISSINDFTTEKVEIEVKVSRGENSADVEKLLYAYTDCEVSVSVNCIVIKDGRPYECGVSDLLRYNTEKLVADLKRELEIEKDKLSERLNDLTLEMIFIENRIYKKIEEIAVYDEIISTVMKELNKYKKLFIRELKTEDIERLLEIKIKRISRFDIENHKKNIDDIVRQLEMVKERLKDVVKYTIDYLDNLIKKYGGAYRRKTKIKKIKTLSANEIAQPDVKVFWDKKTGFLGTDVKGDERFTASPVDKFLVISKDCSYKVVSIDCKTFIDTKVEYLAKYDDNVSFSLIYTDLDSKISYAKKFKISKYLTNKVYSLSPFEKGRVDYLSINPKEKVVIEYIKKPKQKINSEVFSFSEVEEKSSSAKGIRVSTKELDKVTKK